MTIGGGPSMPLVADALLRPARRAVLLGLAHVVEEQVHGRRRELPGPFAGRRVERDLDALEAVALELALEHAAQRLVEVGEHRVEGHLDGQHAPTLNRIEGVAAKNRAYFRAEQRVGSPPTCQLATRLRRGPLLELPVRADASRPAGDRRGAARAPVARPGDGARARDRLRRRRQPDRDGGRPRRASRALGVDLAAEPIAEGSAVIAGGRDGERRAAPGRHLRSARRAGSASSTSSIAHGVYAWIPEPVRDDLLARSTPPRGRRARVRLLQRQPRRLHAPGAARGRAAGSPGTRAAARRAGRARAGALPLRVENRAGTSDWWGGLLESQLAALRRRARCTGSCTTTSAEHMGAGLVQPSSPRAPRRNGLAYVGDADLTNLLPGPPARRRSRTS